MSRLDDLAKVDGRLGLYFREHPTRKKGTSKDRQWVIRQTLGGVQRVSTLGWWGLDNISEGDAINKLEEYKANHKWNKQNPSL
ncbi:MAG: hypothetical protein C0623_06485, partial [Desulfuromonas sp.]